MIHGIGTDIVAVQRMDAIHTRFGGKLARRVLAAEEWDDYSGARDKQRFLAKRFAAKEALAKALGTGMRAPVAFTAIRVVHDALGRPSFAFAPELDAWLRAREFGASHLSLSDETDYAVAFVVVERA